MNKKDLKKNSFKHLKGIEGTIYKYKNKYKVKYYYNNGFKYKYIPLFIGYLGV
jgi:hypothetical protein